MTRHPNDIVWPRRAAGVIETAAVLAAAGLLTAAAVGVWALWRIEETRALLLVASGFPVGALARLAKHAEDLADTYSSWRRQQLDRICTRLETRRIHRRLTTQTEAD